MTSLKGKRIMITGAQGQVGFELARSLNALGADLVLCGRRPEQLSGLGYKTAGIDLADAKGLRAAIKEIKPHILVNPAAYTAVDKAESESQQAFACNSTAVEVMAEGMRELKGALIHFSTDYIYNPSHNEAISEEDEKNPPNVYAASKWAGEQALLGSDLPFITLRTSWVYGINGQNFVKTMLRLAREREQLKIVGDQIGSPTAASTLGSAVASLLSRHSEDPVAFIAAHRGAYNICDTGFTSWYDFAREIFSAARDFGSELKVESVESILTSEYKTPAARPLNSRMSLEKLNTTFAIYPPSWQRSLRHFLYQAHIRFV